MTPTASSPTSSEPHVAVCCPPTPSTAVAAAAPARTLPATGVNWWTVGALAAAVVALGLIVRRIARRTVRS